MERRFRADIEGLRAVAVALVVLFHAGLPDLSGGYVGVDVFFVISGFLITGQLMAERIDTGRVSLSRFYARRIRRLLPASIFVLVATLIAAHALMPPLSRLGLSRVAEATALYVSNLWFAFIGTDYLADTSPSPLQHYWSLAVEEQFYLIWPLLLLLVCRGPSSPRRRALLAIVALSCVSLLACVWLTRVSQPVAFFVLPTRAWELGTGAVLALTAHRLARMPGGAASVLGWAGLTAIVAAGMVLSEQSAFPGGVAILPVAGAAAVIAAGVSAPARGPEMLLGRRPAQWLGRISYSLYLWHWPLMIVPAAAVGRELSVVTRMLLLTMAVGLAALTYLYVENPARRSRVLARRRPLTFALAGLLSVLALALAGWVGRLPDLDSGRSVVALAATTDLRTMDAPAFVPSNLMPALADASDDVPAVYADGCHADISDTRSPSCLYGDVSSHETVVLFGDSHAAQWFPAMERLATERGWRLLSLTKSACPSVDVTVRNSILKRSYRECDRWRADSLARIEVVEPFVVVMSNSTDYEVGNRWTAGLRRTVRQLPASSRTVVLGDTPRLAREPATCLSAHLTDPADCSTPRSEATDVGHQRMERAAAESVGATYVDTLPWTCPLSRCQGIIGNVLVFRDAQHLTATYSAMLSGRVGQVLGVTPG